MPEFEKSKSPTKEEVLNALTPFILALTVAFLDGKVTKKEWNGIFNALAKAGKILFGEPIPPVTTVEMGRAHTDTDAKKK